MGQFSWISCDEEERILNGVMRDVYVLIPKEFGGGHIKETCYEGYGVFDSKDIYELVAEWNKDYLDIVFRHPNWHASLDQFGIREIMEFYMKNDEKSTQSFVDASCENAFVKTEWKRLIGIAIACYDEDNMRLAYPIKIAHDESSVYEDFLPSMSDPDQGF